MKNESGSNINPCGTPYQTVRESENIPFIIVFCCLFVTYDLNQLGDTPLTP